VSDTSNALRAGLVIVAGCVIAVVFFVNANKFFLNEGNAVRVYALLVDAGGVNKKSPVTNAGVQVGEIENITLLSTPLGQYMPDFEPRALRAMGFSNKGDALPEKNDDFDVVVRQLVSQHKLMTKSQGATEDEARTEIAQIATEPIRVAKVDFFVNKDWPISEDSMMKKDVGVIGAAKLMVTPGRSPTMLANGGRLRRVSSVGLLDALSDQAQGIVDTVQSIATAVDRDLPSITSNIKDTTAELRDLLGAMNSEEGPKNRSVADLLQTLARTAHEVEDAVKNANRLVKTNDDRITALVKNVESISGDIADLTGKGPGHGTGGPDGGPSGEGDLRATMASVRKVADNLTVVTDQLKDILGENSGDTKDEVKSLKETIHELNTTLASLSDVAGRVERGEGTVGRLLTDEKIADKVESAVSGAADYVSSLTSIEAQIDIGTNYEFNRGTSVTTASLAIIPKPDKFYLVEVVDDGGHLERSTVADQNGNSLRESILSNDNQLRISAMFAKKFFDFLVLRVGLIENTGGAGMNLYFLDNRIEFRSDLFDFTGPRDTLLTDKHPPFYLPRWRSMVKAQPIQFVYLSAGVDDVLNSISPGGGLHLYNKADDYGLDWFLGAGLVFKDDDLRTILPFIPK
jgi:phospholipid/cholesterol/gamma-HCH transport system substrate-binding protein